MLADPEPQISIRSLQGESAVVQRHAGGPDFLFLVLADFLQLLRKAMLHADLKRLYATVLFIIQRAGDGVVQTASLEVG